MNPHHYYHYILKLVKTAPDEWEDEQVGTAVYGDSFQGIYDSAVTTLKRLGGGDEYRAYIGREDYDPDWLAYFAHPNMEHIVLSVSAGHGQVVVLNDGALVS